VANSLNRKKKKLRKQQQQNGKQTEENKTDHTPQEAKQNDNTKSQTSEKTETTAPSSDEAPKTNDTPTKNANEKNGVKEGGDKVGDAKEKPHKQQPPQKKTVEKKLPSGNEKKFPSGIEIKDLKVGSGSEIKHGQVVKLMYAGQLSDKQVFDKQLVGSGFEYKFGSEEGLKGWNLGMKGMKLGGKRRITLPPKFAFGADGNPAKNVPGDATVTYTIEILEETKQ